MKKTICATFCGLAGLIIAVPAFAQNTNKVMFNVGGGFTQPVRETDGRLNTGFNVNAGVGVNFHPRFGMNAEFGFNNLSLTDSALSLAGMPNGSTRIYSATLNPIFRFNPRGRFDAYVTGGGGFYRRTLEFTEPSISSVTAYDPWYGFYNAPIAVNTVLGSASQNKGGINGGAGITIRLKGDSNAKLYAEARYHYIYTTPGRTSVLPVTFGFRW